MTNPIWLIKTRMALQNASASPHNGRTGAPGAPFSSGAAFTSAAHAAAMRSTAAAAAGQQQQQIGSGATYTRYRGLLHAFATIGREEGIRGFYKGLAPSLILVRAAVRLIPIPSLLFLPFWDGRSAVQATAPSPHSPLCTLTPNFSSHKHERTTAKRKCTHTLH